VTAHLQLLLNMVVLILFSLGVFMHTGGKLLGDMLMPNISKDMPEETVHRLSEPAMVVRRSALNIKITISVTMIAILALLWTGAMTPPDVFWYMVSNAVLAFGPTVCTYFVVKYLRFGARKALGTMSSTVTPSNGSTVVSGAPGGRRNKSSNFSFLPSSFGKSSVISMESKMESGFDRKSSMGSTASMVGMGSTASMVSCVDVPDAEETFDAVLTLPLTEEDSVKEDGGVEAANF